MPDDLIKYIMGLEDDKALEAVRARLDDGQEPLRILEECRHGMSMVGDLFQKGDYYLAELILSADIFKRVVEVLNPHLAASRPSKPLATVLLATLKGDIHDLGKNIVATLLQAHGFEVHDIGVDVPPDLVVEKVKEVKPEFVGFSALITSAFGSMKEAVDLLQEAGLRDGVKIMVGGGVTTPMVKDYVGADFQTRDAMEGVAYCLKTAGGN